MSSDYHGGIAGEMADRRDYGEDDYDPWRDDPEAIRRAEEPPDWYLEQQAQRAYERHCRDEHGGGECDCPEAEPDYSEEAPF